MHTEAKRTILGSLSDKLRDYLIMNHPFVAAIPSEIGKESTNTFEGDISLIFAQSESFVMRDRTIRSLVEQMLEVIGLEVSTEVAIEYMARRLSTIGELPKESPVLVGLFYDYAVIPVMRIQQLTTRNLVTDHPEPLCYERLIMTRGVEIAWLFDRMFSKWWQYVVIPYQQGVAEDPTLKKAIKEGIFRNWYAVLVDAKGWPITGPMTQELLTTSREISLAEAFPLEIGGICEELLDLVTELGPWPNANPYQKYFQALYEALSNTDLEQMEELWKEVDITWVNIGPEKVVPVHMMENGYHHPHQISPEFRVLWRSQSFKSEIETTRNGMRLFGSEIGDKLVEAKLHRIDIGMFITAISGGSIDFRIAGQSVPNRPEVQELGMKIFLDLHSMQKREVKFENLVHACVHPETHAWMVEVMGLNLHVAVVAAHEFAHPFLITKKVTQAFKREKPTFEEGKATIFGIMGLEKVRAELKSFYLSLSANIIAGICARFDRRKAQDPTFRPYLNEAMMIAKALINAGIIICVDGKIYADREKCSTSAIIDAIKVVSDRLVEAYKEADKDHVLADGEIHPGLSLAMDIVSEYAPGIEEDPAISELFAVVNRNLYGE
ncbi:MAG: hypothetical protein U9Q96_02445 [Patescibacteria group bacterium]|nr:hypothetical protein [Patescibacteria group bacterium]